MTGVQTCALPILLLNEAVDKFRVTITRHREMAAILIEIECRAGADSEETVRAVGQVFESSLGL